MVAMVEATIQEHLQIILDQLPVEVPPIPLDFHPEICPSVCEWQVHTVQILGRPVTEVCPVGPPVGPISIYPVGPSVGPPSANLSAPLSAPLSATPRTPYRLPIGPPYRALLSPLMTSSARSTQ